MTRSLIHQIVLEARPLVAKRGTWTNHALARTEGGDVCDPCNTAAVRFCGFGALVHSAYKLTGDEVRARKLADRAAAHITGIKDTNRAYRAIYALNDGASATAARRALLDLFDKALHRL